MAKLSVTVIATVTLFIFTFTLSHARIPLNLPENDVISRDKVQNSDVTTAIQLSGEEASVDGPGVESNSNSVTVTTMPLKFVKFHPINRQVFTLRSTLPFRRCRGRRFHHKFRPLAVMPYGNDMIQSSGENSGSGFDPMSFHGGVRQERPRWFTIHNDHHHHHYHHHHHGEDVEVANSAKLDKKSEEIGLFERFRKFVNQFEF